MHRIRRKRKIVIFSLIGILLLMVGGYASFKTSLSIKGSSKVTSNWDVRITNIAKGTFTGSAIEATEDGVVVDPTCSESGTPKTCDTGLTATINVDLYDVGDSAEYDITVSNKGTIDAKLDDILINNNNPNDAVIITYSGYSKGERLFKAGTPGSSKVIHVKVEYNPEYTGGPSSGEVDLTFEFVQTEGGTIPDADTYLLTYDYQTNGSSKANETANYDEGSSVDLVSHRDTRLGYEFLGWNSDSSATTALSTYTMPSSNSTLYAIYRPYDLPVIDLLIPTADTNSITVEAIAHDDEFEIVKYEFSIDDGATWIDNGTNTIYTFTGLTFGDTYDIKVRVTNEQTASAVDDITVTTNIPLPTFTENITEEGTYVYVTYPEGCFDGTYTCTYKTNMENTNTVNEKRTKSDSVFVPIKVQTGDTILAIISDGNNTVSSSYTVSYNDDSASGIEVYDFPGRYIFEAPGDGEYYLQVWGAQGGHYTGGKGGYSYGTVTLQKGDVLVVYVGGMGYKADGKVYSSSESIGFLDGFNGGGILFGEEPEADKAGGGGSDIRINSDSLYSRVIVAGGGGGTGIEDNCAQGGYGGGEEGGGGFSSECEEQVLGGTQTSGYTFGEGSYYGGGGGWYGGQTKGNDDDVRLRNGSGGGSGYVYMESTAHNYPSDCLLNSNYYLTDAATIGGNQTFPSPTGGTETGHSGNGYAKITYTYNYTENDKMKLSVNSVSTNSISVTATPKSGITSKKFEFSIDGGKTWINNGASNTYTFEGLEHDSEFKIKARMTLSKDKVVSEIEAKTNELIGPSFNSVNNENGGVDTTITYLAGCGSTYTCTYSKNEGAAHTASSVETVHFTEIGTLTATISDGTNTVTETYVPKESYDAYLGFSTTSTTSTITVIANIESNVEIDHYEFGILDNRPISSSMGSSIEPTPTWVTSLNNVYTFTGLDDNTGYYIYVRAVTTFGNIINCNNANYVRTSYIETPAFRGVISKQNNSYVETVSIDFNNDCGNSLTCTYIKDNESPVVVTNNTVDVVFTTDGELAISITDGTNTVSSSYTVTIGQVSEINVDDKNILVISDGDGLYADSTENNRYVYKGKNPDNYITFNDELWRIISVESDGTLKIIRNDSIGGLPWDNRDNRNSTTSTYCTEASTYGCNAWAATSNLVGNPLDFTLYSPNGNSSTDSISYTGTVTKDSSLNKFLNKEYYNNKEDNVNYLGFDKKYIVSHDFYVGTPGSYDDTETIATDYQQEKSYIWNGKVGLIQVTDYLRSSVDSSCNNISNGYDSNCSSFNWIHDTWTISPFVYSGNSKVWYVSDSQLTYNDSYVSNPVRPVVYISSDIILLGSGTQNNPYYIYVKPNLTVTNTSKTITAKVDAKDVVKYEFSIDGGTTWINNSSNNTYQFTGLTTGNTYNVKARITTNNNLIKETDATSVTLADDYPVIDGLVTSYTPTSIKVEVAAHDEHNDIVKYEFSSDNGSTWINNNNNDVYTFTGLTTGNTYNIKARVTNSENYVTTSEAKAVTLVSLTVPTFMERIENDVDIVEITYPSGCGTTLTCTYQKNSESEVTLTTNMLNNDKYDVEFDDDGTLIAKVSDGNNTVSSSYTVAISEVSDSEVQTYETSGYTTYTAPTTGDYYLQVWGAQGGQGGPSNMGGKGGYSYGTVTLNEGDILYIHTGGKGNGSSSTNAPSGTVYGGYNGGGNSYQTGNPRGSGGGATDIRINSDSLYARVIVAGGGGGNLYFNNQTYTAGVGGGLSGTGGTTQATQTSGGTGHSNYINGGFGYGGYRKSGVTTTVAGGGGGWYGGGALNPGGGGSGYVYTAETASNYPSGCLLDSSYYLKNAATISGDQSFESPEGGTETGHAGNGYTKITYIYNYTENDKLLLSTDSVTTNSISITATPDSNLIVSKYEFSSDGGTTWNSTKDNKYTFNGLTHNTEYDIKVRATTSDGKIISKISVKTKKLTLPEFNYELENGEIDTTIIYPSGCASTYTCTYIKNNGLPVNVNERIATVIFESSGTLIATVTDGINTVSKTHEFDENVSLSYTYTISTNSIRIVDSVSSETGIAKYEFSKDNGETWIEGSGSVYEFTNLSSGSYDINTRVTTNFGTVKTGIVTNVSTKTIGNPTYSTQNNDVDDVDVTITYPDGCGDNYTCTYIKNNDTPVAVTSRTAVVNFDEAGEIAAYITDGTNIVSNTFTVTMPVGVINNNGTRVVVVNFDDGLYADSTENGRYIYRGKNVNNYILFNNEYWKIISFENDGTIKIIKVAGIYTSPWDSNNTRATSVNTYCQNSTSGGCNAWAATSNLVGSPSVFTIYSPNGNSTIDQTSYTGTVTEDSSLNIFLNGEYYNNPSNNYAYLSKDKSYIVAHDFYVGSPGDSDDTESIAVDYEQEKSYVWNGKVGLMSATDYLKASTDAACISLASANSSNDKCSSNNWLKISYDTWTISPSANSVNNSLYTTSDGKMSSASASNSKYYRPSVYLSSDVLLGGSGTDENLYYIYKKPTLTITNTSTTISVSANVYSNSIDIKKYEFSSDGGTTWVNNGTNSEYKFTNLTAGGTYSIKVRVTDAKRLTYESDASSITLSNDLPVIDSLVVNNESSTSIGAKVVAHSNNGEIVKYEFSNDNGSTWVDNDLDDSYVFENLTVGNTYDIKVRLTDSDGMVTTSNTVSQLLEVNPPIIDGVLTDYTDTTIDVEVIAHDNEYNITKYEFSSDNGSTWINNGTNKTYTFTGLTTGNTYNIKVRVTNSENITSTSTAKQVIPLSLNPPTFTEYIDGEYTNIEITYPSGCGSTITCTYQKDSESEVTLTSGMLTNNKYTVKYTNSGVLVAKVTDGVNTLSSSYTVPLNLLERQESYGTSGSSTFVAPETGDYYLQVWGAQGGSYNSTYTGGKGGYSHGIITLNKDDILYIYTGGQPTEYNSSASSNNNNPGGYNGGGTGRTYSYSGTTTYSLGGGGASDIRVNSDSLYNRVIVAGGGSGSSNQGNGYAGGGIQGLGYNDALKGKETSAGTGGGFGTGGPSAGSYNYKYGPPGGGGGWYGGGRIAGSNDSNSYYGYASGGGSGYVYTSSTASQYPTGCTENCLDSSYYLKDAETVAGNTSFESPTGGTETGHSGDGYVKVSYIMDNNNVKLYKDSSTTNSITVGVELKSEVEIQKYEFSIDNGSWIDNGSSSKYTFTSLTHDTEYSVKVRLTTPSGKITRNIDVYTDELVGPTFNDGNGIGEVETTITYMEGCGSTFICSYSKNGGEPVSVNSVNRTVAFDSPGTLTATISDGTNTVIETHVPQEYVDYEFSVYTTSSSITVIDYVYTSSDVAKYEYSIDGGETWVESSENVYEFTGLSTDEYTVMTRITTNFGQVITSDEWYAEVSDYVGEINYDEELKEKHGDLVDLVTIEYPSGECGEQYTCTYTIDNGTPVEVIGEDPVIEFTEPGEITATVSYGENTVSKTFSVGDFDIVYRYSDYEWQDNYTEVYERNPWCIVGTIDGDPYDSCDYDDQFETEEYCNDTILDWIDLGDIQESDDITCEKDETRIIRPEVGEYTKSKTEIQRDHKYYLKHYIFNDLVTESFVCYYSDKEHCLKGGVDESGSPKKPVFDSNFQVMKEYQISNHLFDYDQDGGLCTYTTRNGYYTGCYGGMFYSMGAREDGYVSISGDWDIYCSANEYSKCYID